MGKQYCKTCKEKTCLETGKPCKEVEEHMNSLGIYRRDYIRPEMSSNLRGKVGRWREFPADEETLEQIAEVQAFELKYNWKRKEKYRE